MLNYHSIICQNARFIGYTNLSHLNGQSVNQSIRQSINQPANSFYFINKNHFNWHCNLAKKTNFCLCALKIKQIFSLWKMRYAENGKCCRRGAGGGIGKSK